MSVNLVAVHTRGGVHANAAPQTHAYNLSQVRGGVPSTQRDYSSDFAMFIVCSMERKVHEKLKRIRFILSMLAASPDILFVYSSPLVVLTLVGVAVPFATGDLIDGLVMDAQCDWFRTEPQGGQEDPHPLITEKWARTYVRMRVA